MFINCCDLHRMLKLKQYCKVMLQLKGPENKCIIVWVLDCHKHRVGLFSYHAFGYKPTMRPIGLPLSLYANFGLSWVHEHPNQDPKKMGRILLFKPAERKGVFYILNSINYCTADHTVRKIFMCWCCGQMPSPQRRRRQTWLHTLIKDRYKLWNLLSNLWIILCRFD